MTWTSNRLSWLASGGSRAIPTHSDPASMQAALRAGQVVGPESDMVADLVQSEQLMLDDPVIQLEPAPAAAHPTSVSGRNRPGVSQAACSQMEARADAVTAVPIASVRAREPLLRPVAGQTPSTGPPAPSWSSLVKRTYADSASMTTLVMAARTRAGSVTLLHPQPAVARMLDLLCIDEMFSIRDRAAVRLTRTVADGRPGGGPPGRSDNSRSIFRRTGRVSRHRWPALA